MKLDRLMGILTVLLQNDRVTAPYLAEKFEVNRRTIGRDIDALCQAGIPIVTHQGSGGGISIRSYIISWLLSFGDKVKVLEPSGIAAEIQTTARNILSRYL